MGEIIMEIEYMEYAGDMRVDDYFPIEFKLKRLIKEIEYDINSIDFDSPESIMKHDSVVSRALNKHEGNLVTIQEMMDFWEVRILTSEYYKKKYSTVKEREQQQKIRANEAKQLELRAVILIDKLKRCSNMLKILLYQPRGAQQLMVKKYERPKPEKIITKTVGEDKH